MLWPRVHKRFHLAPIINTFRHVELQSVIGTKLMARPCATPPAPALLPPGLPKTRCTCVPFSLVRLGQTSTRAVHRRMYPSRPVRSEAATGSTGANALLLNAHAPHRAAQEWVEQLCYTHIVRHKTGAGMRDCPFFLHDCFD